MSVVDMIETVVSRQSHRSISYESETAFSARNVQWEDGDP